VLAAEAELREQGPHVCIRPRWHNGAEGRRQRRLAVEARPRLVQLPDHDPRPQRGPDLVRCEPPEQQRDQRGLARAVGARDRDPVGPVHLQVDRAEGEGAAAHDGVV